MSKETQRGARQARELPSGVRLLRVIKQSKAIIRSVAFDPSSRTLASGGDDKVVKLWDIDSGRPIRTLKGHEDWVRSVKFDQSGRVLASGSDDMTVKLWEAASGKLLRTLEGHEDLVLSVAFDLSGQLIASAGSDNTVRVWEATSGKLLHTLKGHRSEVESIMFNWSGQTLASGGFNGKVKLWDAVGGRLIRTLDAHPKAVWSVAFDSSGRLLASGGLDGAVKVWDVANGRLLRTLEGHTDHVNGVAFSMDGRLLASNSGDRTLRLWSCKSWETVAVIEDVSDESNATALAFHPAQSLLAAVISTVVPEQYAPEEGRKQIHIWEVDSGALLGRAPEDVPTVKAIHHTTAKVVLVGDHSVGKSGLGWRLAHGEFKEQASTHGQQFWVMPELGKLREDGTECEAILWDLAGQPDYRLIHALFLDDVDLALVLFDSSDIGEPLHGVEFWLKQLKGGKKSGVQGAGCRMILVGAQADRGTPTLTAKELEEFCQRRGIRGYISTSAKEGWGLGELVGRMKELIPWEEKPATTTTVTFKRIKDYVLKLKEERKEGAPVVVTPGELRGQLERTDEDWEFTDAEMLAAVGHLENYGYVRRLRTSKGEERVLLTPELLNNLAASFVLDARRNPDGLGALEESRLMSGGYSFAELKGLSEGERDILLDAAALLFLEHNVCFRETDPLGGKSYLIFPELINRKRPPSEGDEQPAEEGISYTVSGAVENVYASLVVLLGYTQTFMRRNQWQNQARYVMADGSVCGFRQEGGGEGELELVLYYGADTPVPGRKVFEGLFESFLARRNVTVFRYEPVACPNSHVINRAVVRARLRDGKDFAFCEECGEKAVLRRADEPVRLAQTERRKVAEQRWFAEQRSRFEQAAFRVMSYVEDQKMAQPDCFISYAWGDKEHERWVEKNLATDLQKAGIKVLLDRWENSRFGSSIMRFVERIEECDHIVVVGTPAYRRKAKNVASEKGSVAAAEWDLVGIRMLASEAHKQTVLPVLLEGDESEAFPALLRGRVYADFRDERAYFTTAFDLILNIYKIAHDDKAVADLRESLRGVGLV